MRVRIRIRVMLRVGVRFIVRVRLVLWGNCPQGKYSWASVQGAIVRGQLSDGSQLSRGNCPRSPKVAAMAYPMAYSKALP